MLSRLAFPCGPTLRADFVASGACASGPLIEPKLVSLSFSDDLPSGFLGFRRGRFLQRAVVPITTRGSHEVRVAQSGFCPHTPVDNGDIGCNLGLAIDQPKQRRQQQGEPEAGEQTDHRLAQQPCADRAAQRQDREQKSGGSGAAAFGHGRGLAMPRGPTPAGHGQEPVDLFRPPRRNQFAGKQA